MYKRVNLFVYSLLLPLTLFSFLARVRLSDRDFKNGGKTIGRSLAGLCTTKQIGVFAVVYFRYPLIHLVKLDTKETTQSLLAINEE